VRVTSFAHKAIRKLFEQGDSKGLPPEAVDKLRKMLAFLEAMREERELRDIPVWKAHRLTGNHRGTWSLHVTRNWRLTFRIDGDEVADVNLEDYH
jgi:proteic killer suppression protein